MAIRTNATIKADIVYQISELSERVNSEQGSVNFQVTLAQGTGQTGINAISYFSGDLPVSSYNRLDLTALPKYLFNSSYNLNFTNIKAILIENQESGVGPDISIRATGTNALTGLFNGGSGNWLIKPQSVFLYSDRWQGITVSSSHRYIYLHDVGASGATYSIIIAGVTG